MAELSQLEIKIDASDFEKALSEYNAGILKIQNLARLALAISLAALGLAAGLFLRLIGG